MKRSYLTLIGISHLALAACVVNMDLGDIGDSTIGDTNLDDLGGGSGVSTASANEGELIGGTASMAASDTSGNDGDNDTMTKDAGGADDSGHQQLDSAQTDQGDLGLDPPADGRENTGIVG